MNDAEPDGGRSTVHRRDDGAPSTVHRRDTSKATEAAAAARTRKTAERLAADLSVRLDALDGEWLSRLTVATVAEADRRGPRSAAQRLASDLGPRVDLLDDDWLTALAGVILAEVDRRGLPVPEPDTTT